MYRNMATVIEKSAVSIEREAISSGKMVSCLLKSPVLSLKSHSADFFSISLSCSIA